MQIRVHKIAAHSVDNIDTAMVCMDLTILWHVCILEVYINIPLFNDRGKKLRVQKISYIFNEL